MHSTPYLCLDWPSPWETWGDRPRRDCYPGALAPWEKPDPRLFLNPSLNRVST
ncbi:hypothetical protein [Prochlorothrix hollandica]|uniref:hypothetical protein n=1 Tax=Prochlorothrix hollandica TaxID=1223 RepID=UPI00034695EC|nr:hypothetical protein [Prochlorothrix hollandica]